MSERDDVDETSALQQQQQQNDDNDDEPEIIPTTFQQHARRIIAIAFPNWLTYMGIFSIPLVATIFIGRRKGSTEDEGVREVAAFLLAVVWQNLLGLAAITGFVMALDTLLPQAVGQRGKYHPQIYSLLQRTLFLGSILVLFVLCPIFLTAPSWLPDVLPSTGGDAQLGSLSAQALRLAACTLVPYLCEEILQCFLATIDHTWTIVVGAAAGAVANVIFNLALTADGAIGFDGAVVSWSLAECVMVIATLIAARHTGALKTWGAPSCKNFCPNKRRHWVILSHALPCLVAMLCEWSSFEILGIIASILLKSKEELAAQLILQQLMTITFPTVLSIGIAMGILVGIDTGAGRVQSARTTAVVAFVLIICEFVINASITIPLRSRISKVFTSSEQVASIAGSALPAALVSHVCDCCFFIVGCILRSHGRQALSVGISLIGYWLVGLPLAFLLTKFDVMPPGHRILGLWVGAATGQAVAALLGAYFVFTMDWTQTDEMQEELALSDEED